MAATVSPPLLYSFTFGGILPLVSLLFARVLGDTADTEATSNPELTKAKHTVKELQAELDAAEARIADAEARALTAEQRFAAAGDLLFYDVRPANGRPSFNSWYRQSVTICRSTAESPPDDLN